jgi:hypothetical protein
LAIAEMPSSLKNDQMKFAGNRATLLRKNRLVV